MASMSAFMKAVTSSGWQVSAIYLARFEQRIIDVAVDGPRFGLFLDKRFHGLWSIGVFSW
jgi:hypothetical protein